MYFPLFLDISGAKFLIVGAGNVALAKAEAISEFTNDITLLADNVSPNISNIQSLSDIKIIQGFYNSSHIAKYDIIIAATNDEVLNERISLDAKQAKKLVNIVDNPKNSDFIFGANIKKGAITISIASSGVAPVLSRLIKQRILKALPKELGILGDFLQKNKGLIRKAISRVQPRRLFYQDILEGNLVDEIEQGNLNKAQNLLENTLQNSNISNKAAIYFISAGPGDPELITLKAIKLLSKADVVLYDRLVASEILDYARRDAIKINVGKVKDFHLKTQDQINELMRKYALQGKVVARLKGGDATIFARLSEEIDAIKDLNIPYQIVPGITAASGAAAYSGISLTSRNSEKSVKFLTLYKDDLVNDKFFQDLGKSQDTLVFYMSSHHLGTISQKLIQHSKKPDTKIAIIEQATTKYQKTYVSTLENFAKDFGDRKFTSPSLAIVGDVVKWHESHKWREENFSGNFFNQLTKNHE